MRILVIEDDADIRSMLAFHLKAIAFAVDTIDCGEKGARMAQTNEYDLIVMDYMLPKKNGREICKELRESGKTMPIIMLSVRSATGDKVELLNCGADDYLSKPFSFEELHARAKALLRRPKEMHQPELRIGDLVINTEKQQVTRAGKELYLTRKEFSLLDYLARNKDKVVSRGMIMEHVWDIESDPFSNTIEAHILNLRKKLGQRKTKLIHTVPGRGYKLGIYS